MEERLEFAVKFVAICTLKPLFAGHLGLSLELNRAALHPEAGTDPTDQSALSTVSFGSRSLWLPSRIDGLSADALPEDWRVPHVSVASSDKHARRF